MSRLKSYSDFSPERYRRYYSGMDTLSSSYTPLSAVRWQAIQFDNEPTDFLWTICGVIS